ncbi:DNA photolyase [Aureococcus anophagefferens]|nr:DNA photolyase [Aureococcus anophagefferens]
MSALAATAKPTTIVWLRDELRVHDNALLAEAAARGGPVLPVYVLDDRVFDAAATSESGGSRNGLVVERGRPADVLAGLCAAVGGDATVLCSDAACSEERKDEAAVAKVAPLAKVWEGTLYHPEDLRGVAFHDLFTAWRTKVEKAGTRVRGDVFPKAATLPAPPGGGYSTKLAPWLSRGCVSPRAVARACAEYERTRGIKNKSTYWVAYWVVFELTWRDYFVFYAQKYGSKLFRPYGVKDIRERTWRADPEALRRWKAGETGAPLVDANMRELAATGFMSNRGRQNVASYLVLDLGLDWRLGAEHFEAPVDYTPEANWGNWPRRGPLGRREPLQHPQAVQDYDPKGDYVKLWIPELAKGFKFPDGARPGKKSHQQDRKGKGGERAQIQRKRKQKSRVQASAWAE